MNFLAGHLRNFKLQLLWSKRKFSFRLKSFPFTYVSENIVGIILNFYHCEFSFPFIILLSLPTDTVVFLSWMTRPAVSYLQHQTLLLLTYGHVRASVQVMCYRFLMKWMKVGVLEKCSLQTDDNFGWNIKKIPKLKYWIITFFVFMFMYNTLLKLIQRLCFEAI